MYVCVCDETEFGDNFLISFFSSETPRMNSKSTSEHVVQTNIGKLDFGFKRTARQHHTRMRTYDTVYTYAG